MNKLAELYQKAGSPRAYVEGFRDHMAQVVQSLDSAGTARLIELVEQACRDDKTIFLVANGGSAAVSTHWVNDLSANTVVDGQPGIRVMSLTDNASSLTAAANDACFEEVFAIQLKANMRPGDLVIAMSVSGNSPNIVRAVEYANAHGAKTVGCVGFDGGKVKALAHHVIHVPSTRDEYGPVEDMFSVIMHAVTGYLTMKRGRKLSH
jgi:D-sedoheptulose 7-phosphate isomerase